MAKIPRTPTFTLTGIEEKIQILQTVMSDNLPWLEYSFGVCERHEKMVKDEKVAYPVCFVDNKTDPLDVRPNDDWKSYAFWDIIDPGKMLYPEQEQSVVKYTMWEYDVALIIWSNLKRIDAASYIETKSLFRDDILNVLETKLIDKNVMFLPSQIFERDITQIFTGYTLTQEWNISKWPYIAFRIEGTIRFNRKCPVNNSYSPTSC